MVSTSLTFLEANTATFPVSSDNWLEMKSFLENIGSNRHLRAQTLTVYFKKPFDSLAETTVAALKRARHFHPKFDMVEAAGIES